MKKLGFCLLILAGADRPVAGARVKVTKAAGLDGFGYGVLDASDTTDAQGRFKISGLPQGHCWLSFTAKGVHPISSPDPFSTPAKGIILRAGFAGAVKGRVVDEDGAPLRNSTLRIYIQDAAGMKTGAWGGTVVVKPDGTFNSEDVPVGKYVIAHKPVFRPGQPLPPEARTITVEPGKTVEVEFQIRWSAEGAAELTPAPAVPVTLLIRLCLD